MSFNLYSNKQAQKESLNFNNTIIIQSTTPKHLGMILDTKSIEFQEHLKDKHSKISKAAGLFRKLQKMLTRPPLR